MIVKNEEEMLGGCLESVKGCVDEMVVVDTGSTDRTKEIALEHGAKVYDFEWIEDFAAARNFAKSHCSSDYVLSLDADERLNPEEAEALRTSLNEADPKHNVIFLILSNAHSRFASVDDVLSGKGRQGSPVLLPRILKNIEGNDWQGAIHETPRLDNGTFGRIDINIVHLGGDLEWRATRQKSERNLDMLLERREQGKGQTPLFWSYLASEFYHAGRKTEFLEALEKGWDGLKKAIENKTITNNGMISIYPSILLQQGKLKEGLEALNFLIKNFQYASPNPANLLYYCVSAIMEVDIPANSREAVYDALIDIANMLIEWDGEAFFDETAWGITNIKAYQILAFAYIKTKRVDEAEEAIQKGFAYDENSYALRLLQIENNLERGNIQGCLSQIMEELNKDINLGPDIWVLAATACIVLGLEEDAKNFLEQAEFRSQLMFVSRHRRALLKGLLVRQAVLSGEPMAGNGVYGVLGAILSRTPMVSTNPVPNDIIKKVLYRLLELGKLELIERFFDARAEAILPGIQDVVVQYLAEIGVDVEDDGLLSPIFLFGKDSKEILPIFSGEHFNIIHFDSEMSNFIAEKWLDHETEQSEAFLFGDLSFLDEEEEEEKPTEAMVELRERLTKEITENANEGSRPVVLFEQVSQCADKLIEVFPKSIFLYYSVDPRVLASRDNVSSKDDLTNVIRSWKRDHENAMFLNQLNKNNYIVMSNKSIKKNEDWLLGHLFARLGEVYDVSVLDVWKELGENAELNQEYNQIIEEELREDLNRWGM
jgi:glycosyltransferase involved in cell wall biosynthesis